jgi:membrane-bound lytic murein transglycosylase D
MPNETRMYVPKLQAMKNIVASPEAFRPSCR